VERLGEMCPEVETAMPDGRDLAQIELAFVVRKRQALVAGFAVVGGEAHLGRVAVGVEANCFAPLALDGPGDHRDALVVVAACDDKDRHVGSTRYPREVKARGRWRRRWAGRGRVRACPTCRSG